MPVSSMPSPPSSSSPAPAVWLSLLLVFALALLLRYVLQLNLDVSWGITMAEHILDGKRLYVDIIETNPPFVVFLYLPAVALARLLSLRPEIVFDTMLFALCGCSLWLSGRILRSAPLPGVPDRGLLAVVFAAALVILPAQIFGEREHIAIVLFLLVLALATLRAARIVPSWHWMAVAGIAAGLVACIKPHFILAIVFMAAAAAWSAKSWRLLFAAEHLIAAGIAVAYAAAVVVFYPEFIRDILPLVLMVYVPLRASLWHLLTFYGFPLWAAMLLVTGLLVRKAVFEPPFSLLLAASCGFALAYAIQGKAWAYQSYPMLMLALCAMVIALIGCWPIRSLIRSAVALAAALMVAGLAGGTYQWLNRAADSRPLAATITALHPHPKMLCICGAYWVAHPLVRQVGGTWVSRVGSLWIAAGAMIRNTNEKLDPVTRFRLAIAADLDRNMLSEDIANGRPDIIVVERASFDWMAWAEADAVLPRQLRNYREVERVGKVTILQRKAPDPANR